MVDGDGTTAGATCPYTHGGGAMLLIADAAGAFDVAIEQAGGRLIRRVAWSAVEQTVPQLAGWPVLVVEAMGVDDDRLATVLPILAAYVDAAMLPAVVAITSDQIDLVTTHLLGPDIRLLCAPTMAERVDALTAAASPPIPVLHGNQSGRVQEQDRDGFGQQRPPAPDESLSRLNVRMAEIARLVSDLNRDVHQATADVADRRPGYGAEPAASTPHSVHAHEVRRLIARRQKRGVFFGQFGGEALFEDPAWDMLLDLYAAELEGTRVSVSSLCIAAGVAPTTALRWITKMTEMALFIRHPDPVDRRRAFMTLSPRASEAMRAYLVAARKA